MWKVFVNFHLCCALCLTQSCILQLEFTKPERGGFGFSLVGGVHGSSLEVKDICCGGVAEQDGRLRVGDILLEVAVSKGFLCPFSFI